MKRVLVRREDYWVYPLTGLSLLSLTLFLYAGAGNIKLMSGLIGMSILYFLTYILRKNYSRQFSSGYLLACLIITAILASVAYMLTK